MQQLSKLARNTGMQVCYSSPPGDHSFAFWSQAFRDSLPWMSWRLGLTPAPATVPAHCEPPVP
jgi:S-formylglutathione hydrolase FrmB